MSTTPYTCIDLTQSENRFREQFAADVYAGLTATDKFLPLKYTYDHIGSPLFEEISQSDPYYVTRVEEAILHQYATDIVNLVPADAALVELGSGSAEKTRHLLQAFLARQEKTLFVPIDISKDFLFSNVKKLNEHYPDLRILGIATDYDSALEVLAKEVRQPRLIIWLGSDIGQMDYARAAELLRDNLVPWLNAEDRLLLGIDLKKTADALHVAYSCDIAKPLNKSFTINPLVRINREFDGNFILDAFQRRCYYDEEKGCVKVYLECTQAQQVHIKALDLEVSFAATDQIHIHNAFKYDQADIEQLAERAGLRLERQWFDAERLFSVNLFALDGENK